MIATLLMPCLLLLAPTTDAAAAQTSAAGATQKAVSGTVESAIAATDFLRTAKLRKLHLVRPDLIPYPLAYEVYC